ncbi:hypothetical protein LLH23_08560 [bacterium]|nr:hypothetical protein [bacterium]
MIVVTDSGGEVWRDERLVRRHLDAVRRAIPLQLLAYHIARFRGEHIDQPRNLAKTVTVE